MTIDIFFNSLQLIGGFILLFGYIPQIQKIIKTKNVESFSLNSLLFIAFGIFLMEIYAGYLVFTYGKGQAFLITNTLSLTCAIIIPVLFIKYKKHSNQ